MPAFIDITGNTYNRLTVINRIAIGYFKDNKDALAKAIKYLTKD